jgi:hypothetical protein
MSEIPKGIAWDFRVTSRLSTIIFLAHLHAIAVSLSVNIPGFGLLLVYAVKIFFQRLSKIPFLLKFMLF